MSLNIIDVSDKMILVHPHPHLCQICAHEHEPELPHNRDTLYYNVWFKKNHDREPTWHDAMAHCTDKMKKDWTQCLKEKGIEI